MQETTEDKKEEPSKVLRVGFEFIELVEHVRKKFKEQYNFSPSTIHLTNLIGKRVLDSDLF